MKIVSESFLEITESQYGNSFLLFLVSNTTKRERYLVSLSLFENLHLLLTSNLGVKIVVIFCEKATYSEFKCLIKKLFAIKKLTKTVLSPIALSAMPDIFKRLRPKYRNLYLSQISKYSQFEHIKNFLLNSQTKFEDTSSNSSV